MSFHVHIPYVNTDMSHSREILFLEIWAQVRLKPAVWAGTETSKSVESLNLVSQLVPFYLAGKQ